MNSSNNDWIFDRYVRAKEYVITSGYASEIDWQQTLDFNKTCESDFIREAAWVILSSGMREKTIRSKFSCITEAFLGFPSASIILEDLPQCRKNALEHFNHEKKIDAIISCIYRVAIEGYDTIKSSTNFYGVKYLQSFDFLGPATSYHLAKNLGINVSKPDRHLCNVAKYSGFNSVDELCQNISGLTGDPASLVDIVIWRFATLHSNYTEWFNPKITSTTL